jgi:hypothetical protein
VSTAPVLVVTETLPLRLCGSGFAPGERVEVTVTPSAGAAVARSARADGDGVFLVEVEGVDAAGGLDVVAAGDAGGRASVQFSAD